MVKANCLKETKLFNEIHSLYSVLLIDLHENSWKPKKQQNNWEFEVDVVTFFTLFTVIVYSTSFTLGDAIFHFPNNGCFIQQKKKEKSVLKKVTINCIQNNIFSII